MSAGLELFLLVVGSMDAVTGILLMVAPLFTLRLMGLSDLPTETVYLRFVGVFVASIGSLYLYPFLIPSQRGVERRLRVLLETTAVVRGAVCLFVTASLLLAALDLPWLSVALTDGLIAAIQLAILRGLPRHAA